MSQQLRRQYSLIGLIIILIILTIISFSRRQVGERLSIICDQEICRQIKFQAYTPFHIQHGWIIDIPGSNPLSVWDFELDIDGNPITPHYTDIRIHEWRPLHVRKLSVFNFSDGMTGNHTFTGRWIGPCIYVAVYTGEICLDPDKPVVVHEATTEVSFGP